MATPIGHTLAGWAVYRASTRSRRRSLWLLLLYVALANVPDVDFVPGVLAGRPALYHQGPTHSLAAALLVSVAVAACFQRSVGFSFLALLGFSLAAFGSHLAIDLLGRDRTSPFGLPLFWPFSGARFISPTPIFLGVRHAPTGSETTIQWIGNILSLRNLAAVGLEIALIGPFVLLGRRPPEMRDHAPPSAGPPGRG